jgi:hypothetical protein
MYDVLAWEKALYLVVAPLPLADLDVEDGSKVRDLDDMIEETMYWMDRYRPAGQGEPVRT